MIGRDVSKLFVSETDAIGRVIETIDRSGRVSIALVVDPRGRLINTISDGDVRRGLLAGLGLDAPASKLLEIKARTPFPEPVTAPAKSDPATLLSTLQERGVRQLPLVNRNGVVKDIVIRADFQRLAEQPFRAVVMAGGKGTRLRPLTENTPKPMLPVGGRPVLELIVGQLRDIGIRRIHLATHYQSEKIIDHFGGGESFGVDIQYLTEETPLGTGGALGLLDKPQEPVLVINGDVLTHVDFRAMFAFHQDQKADMTVGVRRYEMQVPYGVVECDGARITGLREKPSLHFFVNAGIYLLEPCVFEHITANRHQNMTDLAGILIESGRLVASYPICEYWLDIGQHDDYQKAQADALDGSLHHQSEEEFSLSPV
jgi:dTDP-glucose pyrophosphorylase